MKRNITHLSLSQQEEQTMKILFDTVQKVFYYIRYKIINRLADISDIKRNKSCTWDCICRINRTGKSCRNQKLNIPSIRIMDKEFTNIGCTTSIMNETIIGVDLLKYGRSDYRLYA